jgi:hypothetical protein
VADNTGSIHVTLTDSDEVCKSLDGRTFQVFVYGPGRIKLTPVTLAEPEKRCPVIVGGERCGCQAGHEGKHQWGSGD